MLGDVELSNILIHQESKAALLHNILDFVELLLKHGAQVNAPTIDGTTPLMIACKNGYLDLVNMLLKQKKISVGQRDNNGNTSNISHCQNRVGEMAIQSKIVPYHIYRMEKSEQKSNERLISLFQDVLTIAKENNESLRNLIRR